MFTFRREAKNNTYAIFRHFRIPCLIKESTILYILFSYENLITHTIELFSFVATKLWHSSTNRQPLSTPVFGDSCRQQPAAT